jgi:hypothetical protein
VTAAPAAELLPVGLGIGAGLLAGALESVEPAEAPAPGRSVPALPVVVTAEPGRPELPITEAGEVSVTRPDRGSIELGCPWLGNMDPEAPGRLVAPTAPTEPVRAPVP